MKNHITNLTSTMVIVLAIVTPWQLTAQHLEITPFAGYETGGRVSTNLGYLRVDGGLNFGGSISFGFDEDAQLEFTYNHLNSELSLDNGAFEKNLTPVNVDYYLLGAFKAQRFGERFLPYAGGSFGFVHYGTPDKDYGNESLFVVSLAGGLKILVTERIGFRMQARLLLPLYYTGAYFESGTGGSGYGITSSCVMVQGDFTGALFFIID